MLYDSYGKSKPNLDSLTIIQQEFSQSIKPLFEHNP